MALSLHTDNQNQIRKAMKKLLLSLVLVALLSVEGKSQTFITSFGVQLGWNIPTRVETVIYHDYINYNVVHATRVVRYGITYFDLVLQQGDIFVEVSVRNDGFIYRRNVVYEYPFYNHVCGSSCGYHSVYYSAFYNDCSGHSHHGHNHVIYNRRGRDRYVGYGYYGNRRVVYNDHAHGNGHGYGHSHGNGHGVGHSHGNGHGKGHGHSDDHGRGRNGRDPKC